MGKLLSCFEISRFYRKGAKAVGITVCIALLAAAGMMPAFAAERSQTVNPPPGTYWSEELGVYVFDPPVPITLPQSLVLPEGEDLLYFDGDTMYFSVPQSPQYFVLTKMTKPDCEGENWILTGVLLGCFNMRGQTPDVGRVVIYDHLFGDDCLVVSPEGDSLGDVLGSQDFQGLPYDPWYPDSLPRARWTEVPFDTPVPISGERFWVAWDYMTGWDQWASYYILGNYRSDPPLEPEDYDRFYEWFGNPCPSQLSNFGPWLIRARGRCYQGEGMVDIKPQSCPNPLNVKSKGVLPIAILGTEDLDVQDIDPATILMEGVPPLRWAYEDVATPFPGELCDCWTEGPDGWEDLTVKFEKQAIVEALGEVNDRDTLELTVTWNLLDGSSMSGSDCVVILHKPAPKPRYADIQTAGVRSATVQGFALFQNTPNPVKSRTSIMYSLPENARTTLTVHDASGAVVATLVEGEGTAGFYTAEWIADVPAGVYFYTLESGKYSATKKLIRLQ